MTNSEFVVWCEANTLSVELAALVLGCSRATAFRYASNRAQIPAIISNQCELIDMLPAAKRLAVIQKRLGFTSKVMPDN